MRIFKNKWVLFLFITVILIITIALSSNPSSPINFIYKAVSVPLAPVQNFFSAAARRISDTTGYFFNYGNAADEYTQLKEENEALKETIRQIEHYKQENENLKELLEIKEASNEYNYITASVISYDTKNWYNIFSINKGTTSGVKINDCVVTSKGLVGKVISAAPTTAKVMSIVSEESNLMGRLSKTNDIVRIRGTENTGNEILCKADRIYETVDIAVGDTIETAENEVIYPKGIVIGRIKEILTTENNERYALVEPVVDFRRIDVVMIMSKPEEKTP